jgi:hypothetical protein
MGCSPVRLDHSIREEGFVVRGCAVSLLAIAAGWGATVGATMFALRRTQGLRWSELTGIGVIAGSLLWIALACAWVAVRTMRERARLAAASRGERPRDGKQAVLVGRLEAVGPRLTSPFHGTPCVAYRYQVLLDTGAGRRRRVAECYRGVGLTPAVLVTRTGNYRLLAVPEFEGEFTTAARDTALANATAYIGRTTFSPAAGGRELEARWSDADGEYRSDVTWVSGPPIDLGQCQFQEAHVPPVAEVTLIGLYSQDRGGIVANPNWGTPTRLLLGDATHADATLRSRVRIMMVVALLCAAGAGVLMLSFLARVG